MAGRSGMCLRRSAAASPAASMAGVDTALSMQERTAGSGRILQPKVIVGKMMGIAVFPCEAIQRLLKSLRRDGSSCCRASAVSRIRRMKGPLRKSRRQPYG